MAEHSKEAHFNMNNTPEARQDRKKEAMPSQRFNEVGLDGESDGGGTFGRDKKRRW